MKVTYTKSLLAFALRSFRHPLRFIDLRQQSINALSALIGVVVAALAVAQPVTTVFFRLLMLIAFPISFPVLAIAVYYRDKEEAELDDMINEVDDDYLEAA